MNAHYKKYLPYIVFFTTLLVGTVTMLTALQLKKPPEEEPVVSVPSKAEEGFTDLSDRDRKIKLSCDSGLCGEEGVPDEIEVNVEVSTPEYKGDGKYDVSFSVNFEEPDNPESPLYNSFRANVAWKLFLARKGSDGLYDSSSCNRDMSESDEGGSFAGKDALGNGDSRTVSFTVPEDQRWCGCFQVDVNVSEVHFNYGTDQYVKYTYVPGPGSYANGLGGTCAEEYVCPITPRGDTGYELKSTWKNDDPSTNTINITWQNDIQNETGFELYLISDGTPDNPSEGAYFLLGEDNPIKKWSSADVSSYTWKIPEGQNDVNGNPLISRDYYRFLLRATYDGSGDVPTKCHQQAAGGRIERPEEDLTCPVTSPDPDRGYGVKASWEKDNEALNTINLVWDKGIMDETRFEIYLISDGTPQNPAEGDFFLLTKPIAELPADSYTYKWAIPEGQTDVNGVVLTEREYYRFLVRAYGERTNGRECHQQASGGKIVREAVTTTYLKCNENYVCETVVCESGADCTNSPRCTTAGDACAPSEPICTDLSASPTSGDKPLTVEFTGTGEGEGTLSYRFIFGDDETITSPNNSVRHTYTDDGTYEASLVVISDFGESGVVDACKVNVNVNREETHTKCENEACIEVSGAGSDECSTDADCKVEEVTHLICRNNACVAVSGKGTNECSTNSDCYLSAAGKPGGGEEKPLVPETGREENLSLYVALSLGLIVTGGVILLKGVL